MRCGTESLLYEARFAPTARFLVADMHRGRSRTRAVGTVKLSGRPPGLGGPFTLDRSISQ
jgi:hypothetical protein